MPISLSLIDFIHDTLPDQTSDEDQQSLEAVEQEPATLIGCETDVSRAAHSALIMRPIYELETRRFGLDGTEESNVWESVDLMWTAFAILDAISELTEYQAGATRADVVRKLMHLMRQQVNACKMSFSDEILERVIQTVFDRLANRSNRYLPFSYTYFDGPAGKYSSRSFWLIKTVYTGEGKEALFSLTDEGYVAYFGLHETSALDGAAIGNLRIKLLIERGNLDDAISVAESNRKQCARKAHEVRTIRRLIRRNIKAVPFAKVKALAEEGVNQAMDVQKEGSRLHNLVIENMLGSQSEKHSVKLHHLAEKLELLNHQLMKLAGELQDLPEDFQRFSHKLFRRRPTGAFPSMDDVMARIFQLEESQAADIGKEFIARIDPPARRVLFDPAAVIESCDRALERQNVAGDHTQAVLEVDGEPVSRFQSDLSDTLMDGAFDLLRNSVAMEKEVELSEILAGASSSPDEKMFPVAVAMGVFQTLVDHRVAKKNGIRITIPDPEARIVVDLGDGRRYRGHQLLLQHY